MSGFSPFILLTKTNWCSLVPIWSFMLLSDSITDMTYDTHWAAMVQEHLATCLGLSATVLVNKKCFILWMHSKWYNNHVFNNNNKKDNANIFLLSNSDEWYKMQPMTKPSLYLMLMWTFTFKSDNFLIGFSINGKTYAKLYGTLQADYRHQI